MILLMKSLDIQLLGGFGQWEVQAGAEGVQIFILIVPPCRFAVVGCMTLLEATALLECLFDTLLLPLSLGLGL